MKYVKILGLAAVAAMAVMAFVGAGTASAKTVQLCHKVAVGDGKCPAGYTEFAGTIKGTSTNAILTNDITNVTCEHSEVTLNTLASTGTPITGEVTGLTFTKNCKTASGTACTVTVKNLPYHASLTSNTSLTVTDTIGAGAQVTCGFLINCEFTTKSAELAVKSGSPTTVTASKIVLNRAGGFCPSTAEWHATYSVTSPSGLTVL